VRVYTETVTVGVNATGDATSYTTAYINGQIVSVAYVKDDYANGVDWDITGETSGINIWSEDNVNAAKTVSPTQPTHTQAGVAALYAAAGTAVNAPIFVADERIKIIVDEGGVSTSGSFVFTWVT